MKNPVHQKPILKNQVSEQHMLDTCSENFCTESLFWFVFFINKRLEGLLSFGLQPMACLDLNEWLRTECNHAFAAFDSSAEVNINCLNRKQNSFSHKPAKSKCHQKSFWFARIMSSFRKWYPRNDKNRLFLTFRHDLNWFPHKSTQNLEQLIAKLQN